MGVPQTTNEASGRRLRDPSHPLPSSIEPQLHAIRCREREILIAVRAQIKEKREVAKETLLVVFDLGGEEIDFTPGQYFWVELPDRGHQDERGLRRHISVVTSPTEHGVLGLATRLRDTAFKKTLA